MAYPERLGSHPGPSLSFLTTMTQYSILGSVKKNNTPRSFLGVAAKTIQQSLSKLPVLDIKGKRGPAAKVIQPDSKKKLIDLPDDRLDTSKPKVSPNE